jgi:ribonuclease BN (tRNA processing enzyme)
VNVLLLPSCVSPAGVAAHQYLTTFLLNDSVAIDAGSLGFYGTPADQDRVKHLFLSHTHMDHLASLPAFLENVYNGEGDCVTVYGGPETLESVRNDILNDRVWPNFIRLSAMQAPFLKLVTLQPGRTVEVDGLRVTPVAVNHVVPTLGFVVEDDHSAVIFPSDTGPTEEIWRRANSTPNLRAVFLEVAFPNAMASLASLAKHHTPATFAADLRKLHVPARVIAVHIKPAHAADVVAELQELRLPNVEIRQIGRTYDF